MEVRWSGLSMRIVDAIELFGLFGYQVQMEPPLFFPIFGGLDSLGTSKAGEYDTYVGWIR